jgi:hypothetical protein
MEAPLGLDELLDGDTLVIEFENHNCLIGTRIWTLEFRGPDPSEVTVGTKGRRVIPRCEVRPLTEEMKNRISGFLRQLPACLPCSATSYLSFRISLTREDEWDEEWKYERVIPPREERVNFVVIGALLKSVEHEYRHATILEKLGSLLIAAPALILGGILLVGVAFVDWIRSLGRSSRQ